MTPQVAAGTPSDAGSVTPLDRVIADYLSRLDAGKPVSREELLAAHPELQAALAAFLDAAARVEEMAGPKASTVHCNAETLPPLPVSEVLAVQQAPVSEPLPSPFGRYRIDRRLGAGAMGEVYLAFDDQLERPVALKVPQRTALAAPGQLERFQREARSCGALRHRNICPVYDVGCIENVHFIAMAYIDGKPLSDVIAGERRPLRSIAIVVRKIALALEAAHQAGIVHRDLKPGNVMIDGDGEPVVMDFGLARQVRRNDQPALTQSGAILGTPAYMSPEQVHGDPSEVGPASDVFSLGAMLYEWLTGRMPFGGATLVAVLLNVASSEPPAKRPSELRPDCDPQLEAICLKMLAKRPEERYASMKDVAAALAKYLKSARPSEPAPKAAPDAIAATVAVAKGALEGPRQESASSEIGSPPRRRRWLAFGGMGAAALLGVIVITITNRDGTKTRIEAGDGAKVEIGHKPADDVKFPPAVPIAPPQPPVVTPPEAAPAAIPEKKESVFDVNRRAAEWILANKGSVGVTSEQGRVGPTVISSEALPSYPFVVRDLNFDNRELSSADLGQVRGLRHLRSFMLWKSSPKVDAATAIALFNANPGLNHLMLPSPHVRTSHLNSLESPDGVASLVLTAAQVDDDWKFLERFSSLRQVFLHRMYGLAKGLPNLERLADHPQLRYLSLDGFERPDPKVVALLQERNPHLTIAWSSLDGDWEILGRHPALETAKEWLDRGFEFYAVEIPSLKTFRIKSPPWPEGRLFRNITFGEVPREVPLLADDRAMLTRFERTQFSGVGQRNADALAIALAQQRSLLGITLDATDLTDAGLQELGKIAGLEGLSIRRTRVTEEGVEAFRRLNPTCQLVCDFGDFPPDFEAIPVRPEAAPVESRPAVGK